MTCITSELLEGKKNVDDELDDIIKNVSGMAYTGKQP
jgi:hypothetical protein